VIRRCTREYEYVRLISTEGKIKVVDFIPCRHMTMTGTIFVPIFPFSLRLLRILSRASRLRNKVKGDCKGGQKSFLCDVRVDCPRSQRRGFIELFIQRLELRFYSVKASAIFHICTENNSLATLLPVQRQK